MNLTAEKTAKQEPAVELASAVTPLIPTSICFVCTGNTCRSPMAAAVLNHLGWRFGFHAESAGLYASPGAPITLYAVQALAAAGIPSTPSNDYEKHTARRTGLQLLERFDRIIGISDSHAMLLMENFPMLAPKIFAMPRNISDPFGGSPEIYKKCLAEITGGIRDMFKLYD